MDTRKKSTITECINESRMVKRPLAIVLGSTVNALSCARSLGKRKIPVLAIDTNEGVVSKSKFCRFILVESPIMSPLDQNEIIQIIDFLSDRIESAVIFATSDAWQIFLVENRSRWKNIKALTPSLSSLEKIIDKQQQYEMARSLGIPVPNFKNAQSLITDSEGWSEFPVIIKPRLAHTGRAALGGKVLLCKDEESLFKALETVRLKADLKDYLVQSVVGGGDMQLFGYLGFWNEQGQEMAYVIKQKLRQNPPDFGDGSYQITVSEPKVIDISRKLLSGFAYCGLVGIEYKKDPITGEIQLIEINPRTVSGNQIAISSGVDFPLLVYNYLNSYDNYISEYESNVKYVHELWDYWSFKIMKKRNQKIRFLPWVFSVLKADCYALWSASDPYPFLWTISKYYRK